MDVQPSLQHAACPEDHARACHPPGRDTVLRCARDIGSRWRGAATGEARRGMALVGAAQRWNNPRTVWRYEM